ncbi:MAG: Rne/Rng family ribonuclease [Deltaproteobacteria bacterium]|nr:Rne/Rng family ribonuclease [Deltaproteobacteria bacterium]
MSCLLLINADGPEKRVALLENGDLTEVYVERSRDRGIVGNVYKGRVVRVLPGMQAAFVDIGLSKAAFLYAGDAPGGEDEPRKGRSSVGSDSAPEGEELEREVVEQVPIQHRVREGQELLVQVAKEPIGTKGARVTSYISLPGRHLVYMPTVDHVGISRRITSEAERRRLKELVEGMRPPGTGAIVRTVAEGASEESLRADMELLVKLWEETQRRAEGAKAPALLYSDLDLSLRAVRDLFSDAVERLIIDDQGEYARVTDFVSAFLPQRLPALELYQGNEPLFDAYGVELELDRAIDRKVWLKSGGYLIIDQGEALTAIDVNTGRFVGRRNLEDTITKTNLEAVKEVVAQLRLRNIGGLIVIDFIDMDREANRQKVGRSLEQALQADRVKSNVLEISALGLVEMTRKRVRESLSRQLTEACPYCEGRGFVKSALTVCYEVLREIRRQAPTLPGQGVLVCVHPDVADLLAESEQDHLLVLERRYGKALQVEAQQNFHLEQFEIHVK